MAKNMAEFFKKIEELLREVPEKVFAVGVDIVLAILFVIVGIQVIKIIRKILKKTLNKSKADIGVVQFLDSLAKATLYILLAFMVASSNNILDKSSVIAILGSAGIAIGLALQGSLANFAGGILILMLKPFKVGDYIIEDNQKNEGTVMEIDLFYTKLATADNKIIILPNGSLSNHSLTNATTTQNRRLDVLIGISYDTDIQKAREILLSLLENNSNVLHDEEKLVYVHELADSAVILGVRCWVDNQNYLVTKGQLLEEIKINLDMHNINIPFPQMNVHLETRK